MDVLGVLLHMRLAYWAFGFNQLHGFFATHVVNGKLDHANRFKFVFISCKRPITTSFLNKIIKRLTFIPSKA